VADKKIAAALAAAEKERNAALQAAQYFARDGFPARAMAACQAILFSRLPLSKSSRKPLTTAPKATWPQFEKADRNIFFADPLPQMAGVSKEYLSLVGSPAYLKEVSRRLHRDGGAGAGSS